MCDDCLTCLEDNDASLNRETSALVDKVETIQSAPATGFRAFWK